MTDEERMALLEAEVKRVGGNARELTILGNTVRHPVEKLETFDAPASGMFVTFNSDELCSICPKTEQPDLSRITIAYRARERCVESKSLKLYLWSWRNRGAFVEQMAAEIAQRVFTDAEPEWVDVSITQAIRGGIETAASCELSRDEP